MTEYEKFQQSISDAISRQAAVDQDNQAISNDINSYTKDIANLDAQIEQIVKMRDEIRRQKSNRERDRWAKHLEMQAAKDDEKRAKEMLEQYKKNQALEAEAMRQDANLARKNQTIEDATANALWRKDAFEHQLSGSTIWAAAKRVICTDDMGLGKTFQSLIGVDKLNAIGEHNGRTLIICRGETATNFEMEAHRWFGDEYGYINLCGMGTEKTIDQLDYWFDLFDGGSPENPLGIIINYEILARRDAKVLENLMQRQFGTVIVDEAHAIKNTTRNTYKAIERLILEPNVCRICDGIVWPLSDKERRNSRIRLWTRDTAHCIGEHGEDTPAKNSVENVMFMTGTPLRNNPMDLFPLVHLCHPEIFGEQYDYEWQFTTTDWEGNRVWRKNGHQELVKKIRGFYFGRSRDDAGIKLPPQTVTVHEIEPDKSFYLKQREVLRKLKQSALLELEDTGKRNVFNAMALLTRARQATVWPGGIYIKEINPLTGYEERIHLGANVQESAKIDKGVELVHEFLEEEQKTVVFSNFLEPLIEMEKRLFSEGVKAVLFAGPTPDKVRAEIKKNFDRHDDTVVDKWDVVLAHYKLASEGLNLTACTQTVILDEDWSAAGNEQAYKRTDRTGQTEETAVHILRLKMLGSADSKMAEIIARKANMVETFQNEFTFQELAELIRDL
jgi:SNF2 family DNA or RNA helicase